MIINILKWIDDYDDDGDNDDVSYLEDDDTMIMKITMIMMIMMIKMLIHMLDTVIWQ
jgi:hypothetical protein